MKERDDEALRALLRKAIPPVADTELKRDLWPEMLRKLEGQPVRVPWFDWALTALLAVWCLFFPEVILVLLYFL